MRTRAGHGELRALSGSNAACPPTQLRRVVSGRSHWRGPARLTLRQRLVAIGVAGILLTLVVMQSALSGLGTVNREHRIADVTRQVMDFHQDADQQHDALHADVYKALAASGGQVQLSRSQVLADLNADAGAFQRDMDGARALADSVSPRDREGRARVDPLVAALAGVRPEEELYIAAARRQTLLAFTDRAAALGTLAAFEEQFRQLVPTLAGVTTRVARVADSAAADARHEVGLAQRRILLASGAALAGLLALALMLDRVGKKLAEALTEVEAHVDEVVHSEQRSRDFLAYAAHQLRNPISATRASGEALLLKGASRGQEQLLSALVHETGRAGRLVSALLRMARLDQGETPVPRPCDVVELCSIELDRMEARSPTTRWLLQVDGPLPEHVMLSPEATGEALANLLDNARRHAQSIVVVRVSTAPDGMTIAVHDDGPGLPDAARHKAFERFVSLDGHNGSGLGLPIARALAEAQGGHLDYEDDCFVMTLPMTFVEDVAA